MLLQSVMLIFQPFCLYTFSPLTLITSKLHLSNINQVHIWWGDTLLGRKGFHQSEL